MNKLMVVLGETLFVTNPKTIKHHIQAYFDNETDVAVCLYNPQDKILTAYVEMVNTLGDKYFVAIRPSPEWNSEEDFLKLLKTCGVLVIVASGGHDAFHDIVVKSFQGLWRRSLKSRRWLKLGEQLSQPYVRVNGSPNGQYLSPVVSQEGSKDVALKQRAYEWGIPSVDLSCGIVTLEPNMVSWVVPLAE